MRRVLLQTLRGDARRYCAAGILLMSPCMCACMCCCHFCYGERLCRVGDGVSAAPRAHVKCSLLALAAARQFASAYS